MPDEPRVRSLHLDAGRTWRGGQRQVLLLVSALRARGHEPLLLSATGSPLLERAHAGGIATATAPMRADWDLRSAKRLRALVRTWRPDVVHAHDARSHAVALLALAGDPTPLVVTRRVTFTPRSVRVKYGARVTRFIAISRAVKRCMVRSGINAERIDVVYSGVPTPVIRGARDWRTELGWPRDTVIVGIVGGMTAEKGIDALEAIVARLPPEVTSRTGLVFLGGDSAGAIRVGHVRAYGAGFVREIHDAMAGLDLLWHPARAEGLGTTIMDSLALGIPPVAFEVGGIPEIVTNDVEGLLVPLNDFEAFARAHTTLLDDGTRRMFSQRGPSRATDFSVERMTDATEQVYQKVITA